MAVGGMAVGPDKVGESVEDGGGEREAVAVVVGEEEGEEPVEGEGELSVHEYRVNSLIN